MVVHKVAPPANHLIFYDSKILIKKKKPQTQLVALLLVIALPTNN